MEEQVGKVKLNLEYYPGKEFYSDGDAIEEELLSIVKNNKPHEYEAILKENNKWPLLYHLSEIRGNIVEWLPITKQDSVLEIGAGCGAITGFLADKAKEVTCIDLSKRRSLINAYRNQEKDNIEIIVGNFQDIKIDKKYDYITLIGVFEYGEQYILSEKPYQDFLKKILTYAKPGAKIAIAIENKLGMKYWAGCREDHCGKYFEGIEGYTETSGVKTFSKPELEELFEICGIKKYQFYYPYPDYKFPKVIYSDEFLPQPGELNINDMNLDADRLVLFNEAKAFNTIISSKLFPIYSNSYMVILEKDECDE